MRPSTVRHLGTAAAVVAAGLLMTTMAGCGSSPVVPSGHSSFTSPALAGDPAAGDPAAGDTGGPASPAPSACSLLRSADVRAVAAMFRGDVISIDGHKQDSQPPLNVCSFNQQGVYTSVDGMKTTLGGDDWAELTVIADGSDIGDYSPDGPLIHGLGNGAYWDPGSDTVVVLVGRNVFQVIDDVPVNIGIYPDLAAARQRAATALAAKILSHT